MATLLLCVIYLAFINLGLPDTLLGSAWPIMHIDISAPLSAAGIVSFVTTAGTVLSSLVSSRLIRRWGTGRVTLISVICTGLAIGLMSSVSSFWMLILFAIPLGLGGGCVDAALNNYVALHYEAKHMSWLHCFWGVGATAGPLVISSFMAVNNWRGGYQAVAIIQVVMVIILIIALPWWKKVKTTHATEPETCNADTSQNLPRHLTNKEALSIKGVKAALITFVFYGGAELATGLWGSSFLVNVHGLKPEFAALWISLYYFGITIGRGVSGFLLIKLSAKTVTYTGVALSFAGALMLFILGSYGFFGFFLIGLGFAPIYPCMIHETPERFGKDNSQTVIGLQMAFAYTGSSLLPPLIGFITNIAGFSIFPLLLLVFISIMFFALRRINRCCYT